MSHCKDCITRVVHEGTPTGKFEDINGVQTYVAIPTADYDKTKAVLFLTDVFGLDLPNGKLLADSFAKNGFQTYMPDYLNNDPIVTEGPNAKPFEEWFKSHGPEQTRPPLNKVIEGLKSQGITTFAATGYCFGARYVFDLSFDGVIKAAVVSHPSLLQVPDDLDKFKTTGVPLLINSCEIDQMYPAEKQKIGDDILGGGKTETEKYKRAYFAGCTHGFSIRGDMSDPTVKKAKEDAFENAVQWFKTHL